MKLVIDKATWDKLTPEMQALYALQDDQSYRLQVEGVPDVAKLEAAITKERTEREAMAKTLKQWDGLDVTKVRDLMKQLDTNAEMKLIADGKIDEVVRLRTEKMAQDFEGKIAVANQATENEKARGSKYVTKVLDNEIRAAAMKVGITPSAVDDALLRARTIFQLDDDGNAVQRSAEGAVVMSKDGKTPYSPAEWIESMRPTALHWFPAAGGSGSPPGTPQQRATGATVMKRAAFEAMTPQAKSDAAKAGVILAD